MKKFLIIGNMNAITYKEIFPLIKDNCIWMGTTYFNGGATHFIAPKEIFDPNKMYNKKNAFFDENGNFMWRVNGVRWFTNLDHKKRHEPIDLYKHYNEEEYPKYDNYDAINVNKVSDIPMDYDGVMGVPISFLDKYCPEQFEIIDIIRPYINGKPKYQRLIIKRKYMKKFLIIGNMNAIPYKEIFPLIKDNKIWYGTQYVKEFLSDSSEIKKFGNIIWFTNLDHNKRHSPITLIHTYSAERYLKYDNYDAINVNKVSDIPMDYDACMGVPITFLGKHCLEQFEIIDIINPYINGKALYQRLVIRKIIDK